MMPRRHASHPGGSAGHAYPIPASLDALRQSLAETELSDAVVAHLVAQARPALVLATSAADEAAIPLGATKIGGSPDLPPGMAWPTRPAYPDAAQRAQGIAIMPTARWRIRRRRARG